MSIDNYFQCGIIILGILNILMLIKIYKVLKINNNIQYNPIEPKEKTKKTLRYNPENLFNPYLYPDEKLDPVLPDNRKRGE